MAIAGATPPPAAESRLHYWERVLRPLVCWFLLVVAMFDYRTHQRLCELTYLDFSLDLEGQSAELGAITTLDGKPMTSGDRVSLGRHRLAVFHPKAYPYFADVSIWYGDHHLGRIELQRSKGVLAVTANPPADWIIIRGPELSLRLTDSTGLTTNIPTDSYTVEVHYAHWQQTKETVVNSMGLTPCNFTPRLGAAQLTCNVSGATFQVTDGSGHLVEGGELPATVSELPEGNYKLVASDRKSQLEQSLVVRAGGTNNIDLQFLYGGIRLETDPPGATVTGARGQYLGATPLLLSELTVGRLPVELRLAGYLPVTTDLEIVAQETNSIHTNLERSKGTLTVAANPPAGLITIQGPEFSLRLTNSEGFTTNIPTDRYTVEARYGHWQQSLQAEVTATVSAACTFAPRLGALELTCNQSGATFQLVDGGGKTVEAGDLPVTVSELPEGNYRLVTSHHKNEIEQLVGVTVGITNSIKAQFVYGGIQFDSDPRGASVVSAEGQNLGETPLLLAELKPGQLHFELRLAGYSSLVTNVEIAANQTNTFHTNLISLNYLRAMTEARQSMDAGDFDRAASAAAEALQAKPNDGDAITIRNEASGQGHLRQAKSLGKQGDFIGAVKDLELALQSLPGSEEVKQLLADFKKRELEEIERLRVERAERPRKLFDDILSRTTNADLFDNHEIKTSKVAKDVESGIVAELQGIYPTIKIWLRRSPQPENFLIEGTQEFSGGQRRFVIVCGQTADDETQILFKVLEFQNQHHITVRDLLNVTDNITFIPVHPSRIPDFTDKLKAQVEEGQRIISAAIQRAIK